MLAEAFPHGLEGVRQNTGVSDNGHEIGIAVPTRDNVAMQVCWNARAAGGAKVVAGVEAVGFQGPGEEVLGCGDAVNVLVAGFRGEALEVGDFLIRHNEEVSGVIWIAV